MTEKYPRTTASGERPPDEERPLSREDEGKDPDTQTELTVVVPGAQGKNPTAGAPPGGQRSAGSPGEDPAGLEVTEACEVDVGDASRAQRSGAGDFRVEPGLVLHDTPGADFPQDQGEAYDPGLTEADTEEVFVILPEQLEGEIPVVNTEIVPGETQGPYQTGGTERLQDAALLSEVPGSSETSETDWTSEPGLSTTDAVRHDTGDTQLDGAAEAPTDIVDDQELDQLAAELDDESLSTGATEDFGETEFEDHGELGFDEYGELPARGSGRRFWKYALPLAATLVVAVTAFYFFQPQIQSFLGGSDLTADAQGTPAGTPVVDDQPVTDPVVVGGAGGGEPGAGAADTDVRQRFREKVFLALKLGYLGEVANE
jgi:hypothetical protein